MQGTNRVAPLITDVHPAKYAAVTIVTQVDVLRHVEILPYGEFVAAQSNVRQPVPVVSKAARKALRCIGCLFCAAGLLALVVVICSLFIIFANTHRAAKLTVDSETGIERYDLGDLQYGLNQPNGMYFPAQASLSDLNRLLVQKYFSDQLLSESGYRGLVIDDVFIEQQSLRKPRASSCPVTFLIRNLQIFFDECAACTAQRHHALHRSFFNLTALREPFHLILNNVNLYPHICSTPPAPPLNHHRFNNSYVHNPSTTTQTQSKSATLRRETNTPTSPTSATSSSTNTRRETTNQLDRTTTTSPATIAVRTTASSLFQFLPFRPATGRSFQRITLSKRLASALPAN